MSQKTIMLENGKTATIRRVIVVAEIDGQEQCGYVENAEEVSAVLDFAAYGIIGEKFYKPNSETTEE